jgi:hypothetical protein
MSKQTRYIVSCKFDNLIQKSFEQFSDACVMYFDLIRHDINTCKLFNGNPNRLYDQYVIQKVKMTCDKHYKRVTKTFTFDVKTNTFHYVEHNKYVVKELNPQQKKEVTEKQKMETAIEHIGELINKHATDDQHVSKNCVFDVPIEKNSILNTSESSNDMCLDEFESDDICEEIERDSIVSDIDDVDKKEEHNTQQIDDTNDTDENNMDPDLLRKCKEQLDRLREIQMKKNEELKQITEQHQKELEQVAEVCSVVSLEKKNKYLEDETKKQNERKFEADKKTYELIKKDIEKKICDVSKLPPFFMKTYDILKIMDDDGTLYDPNAYDIFMKKYKECDKEYNDTCDDRYGLFDD